MAHFGKGPGGAALIHPRREIAGSRFGAVKYRHIPLQAPDRLIGPDTQGAASTQVFENIGAAGPRGAPGKVAANLHLIMGLQAGKGFGV